MANPLFEMSSQGQSLASPRVLANLAARTARPGTQPSTQSEPYQAPEPQEQEQPQEKREQGWGSWAGEKALNTVAAVGNLLDLPGSSARDILTGRNPLDQWADPFGRQADKNRVSGRDMLREKGLVGKEDTWGNFFGGMALEIATDPTTYLGIGALSRAGKAFSSIGVNAKKLRPLAKEMAETGSKKVGPKAATWIGGKLASFSATPKMVFEHAENILDKTIKPLVGNSVEGTFKAPSGGGSAFASKADLDSVVVPAEKSAWAMVDNGQRIEVYKNPKESASWVIDAEATRIANQRLSQTVMGATPNKLKGQWKSAHRANYGKKLPPDEHQKLLDQDMDSPLRSLVSVGFPFMHPLKEWSATNNPEKSWDEWIRKQPDLQKSNELNGGPPPIDGSNFGPNAPKPSPKAPPVKDAAKEAAMAAAQEEAAARSRVPPQQGRDLLKQLGRTDLDAIGDEDIAKEISRYGLLDGKGNLRTSTLGSNATRALHQAARTFGPNGVDAFPVVETLAKTWGKLNGVDPDEYFKSLNVKAGDVPGGKLGKYVGDPSEIVTQDGVQKIMRMGERVITAMRGADGQAPSIATFMHEIGHDARAMFDSTMQKKMEDAVGAYIADNKLNIRLLDDAGKWTSEAEEIFANGFEAYLATGKPPLKGLAKAFDKIKVFIEDLWRTISGNPKLESYVHPELKKTFDEMLSPGKAKGPKTVAPPATVVSQAADAVDGQADEAAGTKPLPPDQGGGGSSATPDEAEKFTQPQRVDDATPNTAPVNIDQVNQAIKKDPLGVGGNARVYSIDDSHVVRVPKQVKGEILDDFKPIDHPLTKLGIEAGQEVAENSQGVTIRQKQIGEEAGLAIPKQVPEAQRNELYRSRVVKAADMPQEAYDKLAENIKRINEAGYGIDPSKSSNVLMDLDDKKFNLVDVSENKKGLKQGLNDIVVMLMGNTYFNQFEKSGDDLTDAYKKIFDKASAAVKKAGANEELTSGGKWSKEKAGYGKDQIADTIQTSQTEMPTAKPNVSDAPSGQADISGQNPDRSGQAQKLEDLNKQIAEENEVLKYDDSRNPAKYNRLNRLIQLRSELEDQMQKAPSPQQNPLVQQAAQAPQPNAAMNNLIQEAAKEPAPDFSKMTMDEYHAIEDPGLKRAAYSAMIKEDGVWFSGMKVDPLRHKDEIIKVLDENHAARTAALERAKELKSQNIPLEKAVRELIGSDAGPMRSYAELIDVLEHRVIGNQTSEPARAIDWKPADTTVAKAPEVPMSRELPTSPGEIAKTTAQTETPTPEYLAEREGAARREYEKYERIMRDRYDLEPVAPWSVTGVYGIPPYRLKDVATKEEYQEFDRLRKEYERTKEDLWSDLIRRSELEKKRLAESQKPDPLAAAATGAKEATANKETDRVSELMPNALYETAKQAPSKLPPPRIGGLMARARAVDKEAAKQGAFATSDELIDVAKEAPAPKAGVQFNAPKDDVLPHVADAESVLGLGKDGGRLRELDSLPVEKKQVFDELLSDLNGFGEGEREAAMEAVAESLSKAIGREATQEEVQKIANWLDKTSDQFKRTMQRVDKEYVYTPDKLSAKTKGDIGEKLRTLSKKGMGESLTPDEIQPLVEHLGMTPAVFTEGADISEAGIKSAVKEATGVELTDKQAKAASIFMNSDQGSAAKLREAAAKQQKAESVLDRDVGGAPKKIREPYVGGQALEDMPLEESVGKISQAELVKAMAGASDEEIQAIAKKLADDSGVAVEAKGETVFDPNMTAAKIKERAQEEVKELRKQLRKTTSKSEKRALENQIEEIKEAAKQGKKAAQDSDMQGMYRRMNALKMLATKAKDAATKDAYTKLANEVRSDIAKEELGRAYKAADGLSKGVEAFRMENQSAINEGMLRLIDQHDYTKLPRIQSKSFWNAIKNEIKPSAVDVMTKRVGDIKDAEKATNFEANIISKKATDPTAGQILEVLGDNAVREKMSQFQQEIIDQARKGVSPAEAAEALQMSEEKYISSLKEVMDKITEIAQNRIVQFKDATPAEATKNVITHKIAQARWSEIIDLVKGSTPRQTLLQALDVGDNLFMANPATRMMLRLFDPEVMGAGTLDEQEIARMAYKAQERSVHAFRRIMHPIVHYAGRQEFFDHKKIATKLIQEQKMDRTAALKEAQKIIIDRDNELRRYFESKEATKLNHEIFGVTEDQASEFSQWLDSVKKLFPEDILNKRAAGLAAKELADKTTEYAPRNSVNPGRSLLRKDTNKALLDASVDSQIAREDHLKNIPGGTPILNAMSLDEAISGIGHDEMILGNGLSKATLDRAVGHILKNYKDELLTDDLMKNGVPTKEGMEKIEKIARSIAGLPKDHLEQQVPWFGSNFLRDLSVYFEQSYMKQSVSLAAQRLAVKNMVTAGDQKYLLSKFFEQAKMDNHNAYLNVIKQTGRMGDYQRFAQERFNEWLKSGKIEVQKDGLLKMEGKKAMSPADMAEEMMIAKMYANSKELGVSQETFEAAGYWLQGFSRPQELTVLKQMAASALNAFKAMVTIPFAAFHGRNKTSGFVQNVFFGAYDPTANFADRYFKTERQAFALRTGKPIRNIHKELPQDLVEEVLQASRQSIGAKSLTDDQKDALVTEWMRSQVFEFGLVGDRQGHAAEKIIDTTSSLTSQSPGTVMKDKKNWFGLKNPLMDPTTSWKQKLNPIAFDGSPYPTIDRTGARPKLGLNKFDETTFTPGAVGQELGSMVEDTNRVSPFLAFLKQGVSPEEAARRVHNIQFDYSKLTNFEKQAKQFIPFYMFTSRALKLTLTDLLEHPGGKQAWTIRAANRAQSDSEAMPEHIRRGVAIPLGKGAEGQDRYLSGFGLAWEDPLEMMSFIHGDVKASAASVYSKLRPEIQGVGELAFGRSAFFDREFGDLDPQAGRLRDNLLGRETKGLAEPIAGSQSLEFLIGKSPAARAVATGNKILDDRKNPLEKLVNTTTGISISDVNPEAAARIQINQAADRLKELGGREIKMTTVPDWRKERMTPEQLQEAEQLQKMIRSIQSELRDRKKQAQVDSLRAAAEGGGVG